MSVVAIVSQRAPSIGRGFCIALRPPGAVKHSQPVLQASYARHVLPTDPLGTMQLTLQNVVVGSRYRVEYVSDGSMAAEGVAAATDVVLSLSYYQPARSVRIKVRKASGSPNYQPFDTQAVIGAADASVFVSQVADE